VSDVNVKTDVMPQNPTSPPEVLKLHELVTSETTLVAYRPGSESNVFKMYELGCKLGSVPNETEWLLIVSTAIPGDSSEPGALDPLNILVWYPMLADPDSITVPLVSSNAKLATNETPRKSE
jgi:hypothetical protein